MTLSGHSITAVQGADFFVVWFQCCTSCHQCARLSKRAYGPFIHEGYHEGSRGISSEAGAHGDGLVVVV